MSLSLVDIYNLALGEIGHKNSIQSPDERSAERLQCERFYEAARDATLEAFDWDFARRRRTLASLGELPDVTDIGEWKYAYSWPDDCIAFRAIASVDRRAKPIPFELAMHPDGSGRIILTDEPEARGIYTARVTDTALFPPSFAVALGARLGALIAVPLAGKRELRRDAMNAFLSYIAQAAANSANSRVLDDPPEPDWIAVRK